MINLKSIQSEYEDNEFEDEFDDDFEENDD